MTRSARLFAALAIAGLAAVVTRAEEAPVVDLSKANGLFANPFAPVQDVNPTATVATVSGQAVTGADLEKEIRALQNQMAGRMPPEQMAAMMPQMRQRALDMIVNRKVLLAAVEAKKIKVADEEVKKEIDQLLQKLPPGRTLESVLAEAGQTRDQFTAMMSEQLAVQKLLDEETKSAATVTDEDLKKFYDENPEQFKKPELASARHILIKSEATDDAKTKEAAKKKAEGIRERLVKGEDFAKVATETTDDPGSKAKGGLYEDIPRGMMVKPFEDAVFSQKIGDVGPLVETQFGFHIVKVETRTEAGGVKLDEVKERLRNFLENQKRQGAAMKYVKGLREAAKVTYAEGFAPPASAP